MDVDMHYDLPYAQPDAGFKLGGSATLAPIFEGGNEGTPVGIRITGLPEGASLDLDAHQVTVWQDSLAIVGSQL